jgi:cysteine-rich repeat protein
MEDEGTLADHLSGISATDGNWHHIAVTWQSSTGQVILYDNGREAWRVIRGKGKTIPSGGTLVVGREQDCRGGCFDSASGAAGKISVVANQEYGPQDFFGLIEELRIWKKARTADQIRETMSADDGRGGASFDKPGIDKDHPDLVAYWNFNEGSGYTVKDVTNHGHDLIATQPPRWEVVRWLSTCGNGVVEGQEECDDGDARDGNGCSSSCKVEPGFHCTGTRPSKCAKGDGPAPTPRPGPAPTPGPSPSGGGSSSSGGHSSGGSSGKAGKIVTAVLVPVFFVIVGALVYANRFVVYEHFPGVERGLEAVGSALGKVVPALKPRDQRYNHLALDPEELDISPEFLSPAPQRSPGMPGPYQPLGDGLPQ